MPFVTSAAAATLSSRRRRLQRANRSGAGEQARAISFASAAPSNIRGRAELGLYLSKKKGMWMGGQPSLGYDVKERKLSLSE
jgi:hypothetical protein